MNRTDFLTLVFIRTAPGQPPRPASRFDAHGLACFDTLDEIGVTAMAGLLDDNPHSEVHVLCNSLRGEPYGYAFWSSDGARCFVCSYTGDDPKLLGETR